MSSIVVRRLLIDLTPPLPRHWCGGDPFRTAFMNSLSMSFHEGEQFFIEAMRRGFAALPENLRTEWEQEVRAYIGQEATHRRLHSLFNAHLERQGLRNNWGRRSAKRKLMVRGLDPRHGLAITAGYEHLTAILARFLFNCPQILAGCEDKLQNLWLWHAAEEAEHKCSPFRLYHALGGDLAHRRGWYLRISALFISDLIRQTVNNLWRDKSLHKPGTWMSAGRTLFGKQGLLHFYMKHWNRYRAADFSPSEEDDPQAKQWLERYSHVYSVVGKRT